MTVTIDKDWIRKVFTNNNNFKGYVERYAKNRNISVDVALTHKLVAEAAKYYEKCIEIDNKVFV